MRITLTLDDDLATEMKEAAQTSNRPNKDIVNETLRRGLTVGSSRFRVRPSSCGFRVGIDVTKLNQIAGELEIERAALLVIRDR